MSYFPLAVPWARAIEGSTMRRKSAAASSLVALAIASSVGSFAANASAVVPHRSERYLPTSNGRSSIAFDTQSSRVDLFLEHPYAEPASGQSTRNFVFDTYPGIRVGTTGAWNPTVAPSLVEMLAGTGIVHVVRATGNVQIDEYHFAPMSLAETASVMLVKVTRVSGSAAVDAFGILDRKSVV